MSTDPAHRRIARVRDVFEDVGLEMTLLDEAGWRHAFQDADLVVTDQFRVRLAPTGASEAWKAVEGSLVTLGRRPA